MNEQSETKNFRGERIEENTVKTRLGILHTLFCHIIVIIVTGGCAVTPLPTTDQIPASSKLPIDGLWRPLNKELKNLIFKADRGRMYVYSGTVGGTRTNNAIQGLAPGTVFIKDIQL